MRQNIEFKARLPNRATVIAAASRLANGPPLVMHQQDIFFNSREGRLKLRLICEPSAQTDANMLAQQRQRMPGFAGAGASAANVVPVPSGDPAHAACFPASMSNTQSGCAQAGPTKAATAAGNVAFSPGCEPACGAVPVALQSSVVAVPSPVPVTGQATDCSSAHSTGQPNGQGARVNRADDRILPPWQPTKAELIQYWRPNTRDAKESKFDVFYFPAESSATLARILSSAMGVMGIVRKSRLLYMIGTVRVHIDEVERLGSFMEVEVPYPGGEANQPAARATAIKLMSDLCVCESDLVDIAYIDLLRKSEDGDANEKGRRHRGGGRQSSDGNGKANGTESLQASAPLASPGAAGTAQRPAAQAAGAGRKRSRRGGRNQRKNKADLAAMPAAAVAVSTPAGSFAVQSPTAARQPAPAYQAPGGHISPAMNQQGQCVPVLSADLWQQNMHQPPPMPLPPAIAGRQQHGGPAQCVDAARPYQQPLPDQQPQAAQLACAAPAPPQSSPQSPHGRSGRGHAGGRHGRSRGQAEPRPPPPTNSAGALWAQKVSAAYARDGMPLAGQDVSPQQLACQGWSVR